MSRKEKRKNSNKKMKIFIIVTLLVIIIAAGILAYMVFFKNKGNDIISNIEENTQVVENMATTFEKSNSEDLTKKLIDVLEGKNRKTEKELQDYILNKYNWDEITNITQKLYYRIIGKG